MARERRYRDEEVREIFELATRPGVRALPRHSEAAGLTLADLQGVGLEVGLEPGVVAQAAAALEARTPTTPHRTSLGMPVEVGRIVALPRPLTDSEWEHLVAELRTAFGAHGRVSSQGGLREWVNGNLHACIEPSGAGHRLRLGTRKGDAATLNALGAVGVVTGAIAFGALLLSGGLQEAVFVPWMISASGVATIAANWLRLPRWANERDEQMSYVAAKLDAIMNEQGATGDREG